MQEAQDNETEHEILHTDKSSPQLDLQKEYEEDAIPVSNYKADST